MNEGSKECLYITSIVYGKKLIKEKLSSFSSGLCHTNIKSIESYVVVDQKFNNPKTFVLLHDRPGHPGSSMMWRIIKHSHGQIFKNQKILLPNEYLCAASSQGKLIVMSSFSKVTFESSVFLERIHGDICGPIHPPCVLFCYFMVLIDTFTKWSHVCLLSTRNVVFARLLTQIIKLHAKFSDYLIKAIRLDSDNEFTSQTFTDYCMSDGINVEHPVSHTHTQNGLAKSLIKHSSIPANENQIVNLCLGTCYYYACCKLGLSLTNNLL